ncbi:hypothetical protein H6G93_03420 [Nostoc sp. FACHB-973]|nr:hypothetical protein [Nostoc sp. FACHB-973]
MELLLIPLFPEQKHLLTTSLVIPSPSTNLLAVLPILEFWRCLIQEACSMGIFTHWLKAIGFWISG